MATVPSAPPHHTIPVYEANDGAYSARGAHGNPTAMAAVPYAASVNGVPGPGAHLTAHMGAQGAHDIYGGGVHASDEYELATRDHYQYGRRSSARAAAQRSRGGGRSSGRGERPKAAADKDPGLHTPWFTYATMLACVGVFTYCMYLNDWTFEPTSINPLFGPSNQVLLDMGALSEPLVVNGGEWWRLFTPMVLHVGLIHLAFNMLSFYRVGGDLEMAFGFWRLGAIFIVSGVLSSVASALFLPNVLSVGASGSIFGLLGAQVSDFVQNYQMFPNKKETACSLLFSCIINLALGAIIPALNNFAHVGGFIAGVLLGMLLLVEDPTDNSGRKRAASCRQVTIQFLSGGLFLVGGIAGFVMMYRQTGAAWCTFCERINCIPELGFDCTGIGGVNVTATTAAP